MKSVKRDIFRQLRSLLSYHKHSGFGVYPRSEEVKVFLEAKLVADHQKSVSSDKTEAASRNNVAIEAEQHGTVGEIADEVRICRSCDLYKQRVAPIAGAGGDSVKLFIVGGWLAGDDLSESAVFGVAEDQMLERMLKAIALSRDDAFISNIIKCGINTSVQPRAENINACVSYLHRQIAATSPEIICTMGIVATRALLQISLPLSQMRGKLYQYQHNEKRKILVMPTYHPTFLLKNPEMKKATWNDLQLIAKELA